MTKPDGNQGTSSESIGPNISTNVEELLKSAQDKVASITELTDAASESQKLITIALTGAQTKLVEIKEVAAQAVVAKTKIEDEQNVIATKSDHIENAKKHADKVRADLDRELTATKQCTTEAEGLKIALSLPQIPALNY